MSSLSSSHPLSTSAVQRNDLVSFLSISHWPSTALLLLCFSSPLFKCLLPLSFRGLEIQKVICFSDGSCMVQDTGLNWLLGFHTSFFLKSHSIPLQTAVKQINTRTPEALSLLFGITGPLCSYQRAFSPSSEHSQSIPRENGLIKSKAGVPKNPNSVQYTHRFLDSNSPASPKALVGSGFRMGD